VLSGRGLCDELITRPEESYRLCCVVVCDLETSKMGAPYIYDISRLKVKPDHICSENVKSEWNFTHTVPYAFMACSGISLILIRQPHVLCSSGG